MADVAAESGGRLRSPLTEALGVPAARLRRLRHQGLQRQKWRPRGPAATLQLAAPYGFPWRRGTQG